MARPWPRTRSRRTFVFIIAVALLTRAIALFSPLTLSGDAFRYIWDGRVQAAGINPYRNVPADERLALLRDTAIYPNVDNILGPRFKIETRYRLEGIGYVISVSGRRLGETRSLADAKQIAQAHWESL